MAPDDAPSFFPTVREIMAPRPIKGVTILTGGPDPFSAEDWADYDNGRERCSPDLMAREARRIARDRDGM